MNKNKVTSISSQCGSPLVYRQGYGRGVFNKTPGVSFFRSTPRIRRLMQKMEAIVEGGVEVYDRKQCR